MGNSFKIFFLTSTLFFSVAIAKQLVIETKYSDQELLSLSKEQIIAQHRYLYDDYVVEGEDLPIDRLIEGDLYPILKRKKELEKASQQTSQVLTPDAAIQSTGSEIIFTDDYLPVTRNINRSISDTLQYYPNDNDWGGGFGMTRSEAMMVMYKVPVSGTLKGVNIPVYQWGDGDQELTVSLHRISYPNRTNGTTYNSNDGINDGDGWIGGYDFDANGYTSYTGSQYSPGGTQGVCGINTSLNFFGNTYVSVPNNSLLNLSENGNNEGTIMASIKVGDSGQDAFMRILSKKSGWDDSTGYELEINPAQGLITLIGGGGSFARGAHDFDNSWTHLAASFSGNRARIYVDGVDVTTDSTMYNIVGNSRPLMIGNISVSVDSIANGYGSGFNGAIDEVILLNNELSHSDLLQVYFPPYLQINSNVVAHWSCNEGSGSTVSDATDNDLDGSFPGAAWHTDGSNSVTLPDGVQDPLGLTASLSGPSSVPMMGLAWPTGNVAATLTPSTHADYTGQNQSAGGNINNWISLSDYGDEITVSANEWIGILVQYTGDGHFVNEEGTSYTRFWYETGDNSITNPWSFTKFYPRCGGTSGNGGWHIRSWQINYQLAIDYDDNLPSVHIGGGDVYGNWLADTVFIDGSINVPHNQSLTIQEGVTVYFTGHHDFDVYGNLSIDGSETDSVKITSYVDGPGPSSWNGLRIYDHDHNRTQVTNINYAIIENGQNGIYYYGVSNQDTTPPHHTLSNSLIRMNSGDGIGSENHFGQLTIDSSTVTRNGWWDYGVGVWIGWDAKNVSLTNSTITHNGYENEGSLGTGVRIWDRAKNILVDNNLIQYNQPQHYSSDQGNGRGIGIDWNNADAAITNNTITYNGNASFGYDEWDNWGVKLRGGDGYHFPIFQNNIIHSNGDIEVRFTESWLDWDQNDYEVDFRNNDWGSTINNEMSNANNPANISVIYDQLDEEQYPFVNYACWEGADCGYTGDISFANSSGAAYDLALPASVDTLFIHIYDEGDIGDGNVDTVMVYISSDTDSDDEQIMCVGTGSTYIGSIPINLNATRVMTDEQEEALYNQFVSEVTNEHPDWSEERVASHARHLFGNEQKRMYKEGIRVENHSSARSDGILQVSKGDMIVSTYYDNVGDWGGADTSVAQIIFGGYEGRLRGTWTAANSPYIVTGFSWVDPNDTLNIGPGAEVKFLRNAQIQIDGNLWALGTESDSIKFIPFGLVDTGSHSWRGLWVDYNHYETENDQRTILNYCDIKNAHDFSIYIDFWHWEENPDSVLVRINNSTITEQESDGLDIRVHAVSHENTLNYSHVKVLNSRIERNNGYGIRLENENGKMPVLIKNNTIHHNGYFWNTDENGGIYIHSNSGINRNIVIDGNDIRYNQAREYSQDHGQGQGRGIFVQHAAARIINNTIVENGGEGGHSEGVRISGFRENGRPVINNNEIYGHGTYEASVDGWGDYGLEIDFRYNNWGDDITAQLESGTNPQNIAKFYDQYDREDIAVINYSCYEGNTSSCGNGGDVFLSEENGNHIDDTYRLWNIENDSDVDSVYIHLYDEDLVNTNSVSVTLTSETDTTGETFTLAATDSAGWFFGGIGFAMQSARAMTIEEEATFMSDFEQQFSNQYPDEDQESISSMASTEVARIRMERNLSGYKVYVPLGNFSRDDQVLQVRSGDMIYATYSDASDDWGDNADIIDNAIFGGIDGSLEGRFTVENSPYVITGGVHIGDGDRLRIDPGVTIKLFTWTNIDIYDNSSLIAIGTEEDSITFEKHELYRSDAHSNQDQIWYGIQEYNWCCDENDRDTLILKYVNIHNASNAVMVRDWESNSGAVNHVEISHSRFSHNGHGIDIEKYDNGHSDIIIKDSDISWNDKGFYIVGGTERSDEIIIDNCDIMHNGQMDEWGNSNYGVEIRNESKVTIKDSRIMYNQPRYFSDDEGNGRGIGIWINHAEPTIIGNTIAENGAMNFNNDNHNNYGIYFEGIYEDYDDITINNNNIVNNGPYDAYFAYGCCENDSVDMSQNYWGEFTTNEIESGENPQNLTRIYDRYDTNNEYRYIDYKNWRTTPIYHDFFVKIGQPDAIPEDTMGVDVYVATPYDTNFVSAELSFGGYTGKMNFVSIDTSNTLAGDYNWMVVANETSSQGLQLVITAAAGANAISGEGVFFRLNFAIPDTANDEFIPITLEEADFNDGGLAVNYENGGIEVLPLHIGDVDWNGNVQAVDGGWILKHLVESVTLDNRGLAVADVTADETISALDATTILDYVVGLVDSLPHGDGGHLNATGSIGIENAYVEPNQIIDIPIQIQNPTNVRSFEGEISINSDLISFAGMSWSEATAGFMKQYQMDDENIRFAAAGGLIENQDEVLVTLHVEVSEDFVDSLRTEIAIDYLRWNEEFPIVNGSIEVLHMSLFVGEDALLPVAFALHQNYPNPFNPSTRIRFDIPDQSFVRLAVYDILGRQVRLLVERDHDPGFYEVLWDGRDEYGREMSSGVYFYQIHAGTFHKNSKMIVVK